MKLVVASLVMLLTLCAEPLTTRGSVAEQQQQLVQEILVALNALRTNPASFVEKLPAYRAYMRTRTKNLAGLDAAIAEATTVLKSQQALSALNMQGALLMAAQDHAADITKTGVMGHTGSDKSTPRSRVTKYAPLRQIGEVVTYGFTTADVILASFIVDQDTPDRGHRKSLLSADYTMVGIAMAKHKTYGPSCVIVLGGN